MKQRKKKSVEYSVNSALNTIYPTYNNVERNEASAVALPTSASSYFDYSHVQEGNYSRSNIGIACEEAKIMNNLPIDRASRYAIYEVMANDPTIDNAIKMHIANALSSKSDKEEVIKFEAKDNTEDEYTKDLNATFSEIIKKYIDDWAYQTAIYGSCYVRVYGEQGKGITNVRCDYYTLPKFINKYEKGGKSVGFTSAYQGASTLSDKQIQLIQPWKFVGFELPSWNIHFNEPTTYGVMPIDLSVDDYLSESIVESQDYGSSLLQTSYASWIDLLESIKSLNISRKNASRLERLIGIHTGKLSPEKATDYLRQIAEQISDTSNRLMKQSRENGNYQTTLNHIIPIFGDRGNVDINTIQGTPDINSIEDVMFHVKRLGASLGIDPSLLGFGDMLSGGLGDGGFFRVSIMAAIKANTLRRAIANGLQRLAEIHIAYKYNKVFAPNTCTWKITFNSVSTAIEREMQEALEAHLNTASNFIGIIGALDQEYGMTNKREFARILWCEIMKRDEESFELIFPKDAENNNEENVNNDNEENEYDEGEYDDEYE